MIETRKCTSQFPSLTYTRDAGTEVIAPAVSSLLEEVGARPHVVECHVHRSKVECNRDISEVAVQVLGQEGQQVYDVFHDWIQQALSLGLEQAGGHSALLIDLHGHGHPHEYIELGYRLPAAMLNNIAAEEDEVRLASHLLRSNDVFVGGGEQGVAEDRHLLHETRVHSQTFTEEEARHQQTIHQRGSHRTLKFCRLYHEIFF